MKNTLKIIIFALTLLPLTTRTTYQVQDLPEKQLMEIIYSDIPQKHIVVVSCGFCNEHYYKRHLDSVLSQNYDNYELLYIDDASTDATQQLVYDYIRQHELSEKVRLIFNQKNYGAMENQYRAIHSCDNESIIVILDADDAFTDEHVLTYINAIYANKDVWLTYGQFQEWPSGRKGFCTPMPYHTVKNNAFRDRTQIPSHLRTFYAGLFKQIKKEDLMHEGEFLKMDCDIGAMFPMIEMARLGHFRFVPRILCLYNGENPLNDHKVSKKYQRTLDLNIRARTRYEPIESPFNA